VLAVRDALAAGHTFFVELDDTIAEVVVVGCACGSPLLRVSGTPTEDVLLSMSTAAWATARADAGAGADPVCLRVD
jgi:hypothetical protein